MKKLLIILLVLSLCAMTVFSFAACSEKTTTTNETTTEKITIAVPDGGPALGMSYLMKIELSSSGDIASKVSKSEIKSI